MKIPTFHQCGKGVLNLIHVIQLAAQLYHNREVCHASRQQPGHLSKSHIATLQIFQVEDMRSSWPCEICRGFLV